MGSHSFTAVVNSLRYICFKEPKWVWLRRREPKESVGSTGWVRRGPEWSPSRPHTCLHAWGLTVSVPSRLVGAAIIRDFHNVNDCFPPGCIPYLGPWIRQQCWASCIGRGWCQAPGLCFLKLEPHYMEKWVEERGLKKKKKEGSLTSETETHPKGEGPHGRSGLGSGSK